MLFGIEYQANGMEKYMNKKWECYNLDNEKVEELVKKRHITNLLASILVNRGIIDGEKINVFLNPTRKDFYNPFLMPDMEIAVKSRECPQSDFLSQKGTSPL